VTESFLSKEITCVVSSSREAKRGQARAREEKRSSPTAEGTKSTSSVPAAPKGNPARPRQKPPSTALLSRGKELLRKAMKNQVSSLGRALLGLGVLILWLSLSGSCPWALLGLWGCQTSGSALCAAELLPVSPSCRAGSSSSATEQTGGKLKPPFLKVEDQSRQFRPFHHQFQSFPDLNFLAPKSSSPFEPLKSLSNSCQASAGGKSPRSTPVTVPRKRRGFCECCQETFEELQKHLQSPQHQRFARDSSQYIPVDRVISQLTSSF
ncbi:DBF4B protein, partial [Pachycephala philippinensis]|nr:DBF4B protein [Pachycephala philippinensis]